MIEELVGKTTGKSRWFDFIEVEGYSTPISYKNNRIHSINEKQNHGYGIRINIDGRTGFSYTNDVKKIEDAVNMAVKLSSYGDTENFDLPPNIPVNFEPYDKSIEEFDTEEEIEKADIVIDAIKSKFSRANIDLSINKSTGRVRIKNSNGLDLSYRNSYYSVSVSVTYIIDDTIRLDVWESKSSLYPVIFSDLQEKILSKMELASVVRKMKSGKIPVILTPKAFARAIGIVGMGLNAKSVWKGISPFADKLGKKIFNKGFTFQDSPLMKDSPFSFPVDDEGMRAQDRVLIDKGEIVNFITDLKYAEKLNMEPGGNGSRGYASLPSPSFSNIIVDTGENEFNDIVGNIDKGILVDEFIGFGQSNTLTGDFSAGLDLAFLIENGEITGRVKDCMVSDNLFELLAGEIVLSKESESSGSAHVPYIYFPAINYTG